MGGSPPPGKAPAVFKSGDGSHSDMNLHQCLLGKIMKAAAAMIMARSVTKLRTMRMTIALTL
eukprot:scaffold35504_cov29-Prasinocladus_malaysianus.AAC.1